MSVDVRQSYEERNVLEADGCQLVVLLYRAAIEALDEARGHLARGEIRGRSERLTRASEIVNELALSVNHEVGGEIGRNLVELYDYVQYQIQTANSEQVEPPLVEARQILATLAEAWEACGATANLAVEPPEMLVSHETEYASVNCMG